MSLNKTKYIFLALILTFFLVKYSRPAFVDFLFNNAPDFLNQLVGVKEAHSFDFYFGRMKTLYFGPLAMLLSGSALLLICYRYFLSSSSLIYGLGIFTYLILSRWEVLFYPPYGDSASGPFIEAIWLKRHAFDYFALSQQPLFVDGGPKVYLFSIFPTVQALLMNIFSNSKVFLVINHILYFAMGASVIAVFRKILLRIFDEKISLLLSFLVLVLPLYQSQVEQINMEMPSLFFLMLCVSYLADKKILLAAIMAIAATLIKGVAVYGCWLVALIGFGLLFINEDKGQRLKICLGIVGALVFSCIFTYLSIYVLNENKNVVMVGPLRGMRWLKNFGVGYLFVISLGIFVEHCYSQWEAKRKSVKELLIDYYLPITLILAGLLWFIIFINSYGDQYRYRLLLAPFSAFAIFYVIQLWIHSKIVLKRMLTGCVILSLIFSYGLIYLPAYADIDAIYERSLEYQNDLDMNVKLAKVIEVRYSGYTIGAPFTIAQTLAFKELGYVKKSLDVMLYSYPCKYEGLKVFESLAKINKLNTIWVGLVTNVSANLQHITKYPIGSLDLILETVEVGKKKSSIFMGGFAIEQMRLYLDKTLRYQPNYLMDPDKL